MKKYLSYFQRFYKEERPGNSFLIVFTLFLIASVFVNYSLDDSWAISNTLRGQFGDFGFRLLFYTLAYFFPLCLALVTREVKVNKCGPWLVTGIIMLLILSLRSSIRFPYEWAYERYVPELKYFIYKYLRMIVSLFFLGLPLIWGYWPARETGFKTEDYNMRPYWVMLLFMLPLIMAASFFEGFQESYPRYKEGSAEDYLNIPYATTYSGYLLLYCLNFIFIEYFFRSYLVFGATKKAGAIALFSMVSLYCYFHFGKPVGETVGSIFGGFILGVIAYYSRSIVGGIIVHIGIALLMEFAAITQHYLLNE